MKAQQIEVGKVYIVEVSGQLANVRVQRMEEASNGRHRWVGENLETGRKVVVRGAARFRREASKFVGISGEIRDYPVVFTNPSDPKTVVVQDPALAEEERGIEVAAQLRRRRSLAGAIASQTACPYCGGVRGQGLGGCPACLEDLREGTLPEEPLGREALVEQFRKHIVVISAGVASAHTDNTIGPVNTNHPNERTKSMQISESDARTLLGTLGNTKADILAVVELEKRLNQPKKLARHVDGRDLGENELVLLRNIADAVQEGERIMVMAEQGGETKAETQEQEKVVEKGESEETQPEEQATMKVHANGKANGGKRTKPDKAHKTKKTKTISEGGTSAGGMSGLEAAARVLHEAKRPMNRREILEAMVAKGYWTSPGGKTPEDTIKAAMYTEINQKGKQSRFKKAGRGLFAAR